MSNNTYVFRLQGDKNQHDLSNTINHWGVSSKYEDKQINAIESSNKKSEHQPTSIPSPFARIALVKTAFGEVAKHGDNALVAYQKIVSDSLDVAEIFFTFDKWKDKIEIIKWNKTDDLNKLSSYKIFHKTLITFLNSDAKAYNFNDMISIFILKYKLTGEVIGATSPCTIFFSSANNFSVDIPLSNNHIAFADIFPLHKRSWDFQKYLYTWLKINNTIHQIDNKPVYIFDEFNNYLEAQRHIPDAQNVNKISDLAGQSLPNDFNEYDELRAPNVEVLGKSLHKSNSKNKIAINYLSTIDLLEDKIIRLPNKMQKGSFFDGKINDNSKYSYLLPIKEEFFNYFSIDDLHKFIRINEVGTNVEVELKIPNIQQQIKQIYTESTSIQLLHADFDCTLFPNVRFSNIENAYYRFGIFFPYSSIEQSEKFTVQFYEDNSKIEIEDAFIRNLKDSENSICKIYSINQKLFNKIKVCYSSVNGLLLPIMQSKSYSGDFTFAVDFGTTNTHIEYKTTTDQIIKPFDITESDKQVHFLIGKSELNSLVADIDFIPSLIGDNKKFKFPIRTALSTTRGIDETKKVSSFVHSNIVIPFEKRRIPKYNKIITHLKWESTEDEMGYYIDSLCYVLRNKVYLNGGNLSETKIVWFYPLSMAGSRSRIIAEKWNLAYAKYFLGLPVTSVDKLDASKKNILKEKIIELPESVAPFLCYKDDVQYRDAINNLVSIDIGGGTTDIVFIKNGEKAEYVTSFKFAANSIFGLGEYITPIVTKYRQSIDNIIEKNDPQFTLRDIQKNILESPSGDLASFFFSLSDNEMLKDAEVDFSKMLVRDNDQKLVFIIFYAAIIYHTAQIMKSKNLELPRHITFSGNGSRIINIVGEKKILEEITKCIFEKIYNKPYGNSSLEIIQNTKNPKEVTCKGGIKAADNDYIQTPFEPVVFMGIDDKTFASDSEKYSSINIEDCVLKTNSQVKLFFDYLISDLLNQKYCKGTIPETVTKCLNLNLHAIQLTKEICDKEDDLKVYTSNGIKRKIESIKDKSNTQIEETFFFYPIVSLLNKISNEINNIN